MKRNVHCMMWRFALLALLPVAALAQGDNALRSQQEAFRLALRAAAPSIVKIETIGGAQPVQADERPGVASQRAAAAFRAADGPTTGVIWSEDGYILSSTFNFIRDPSIITVTLGDGRQLVGKLVARDHQSRIALLKVDAKALPAARWIEPADLRAGQWALTAGFGFGSSEPAISAGIISGISRMNGQAVQTDAKTSPANYGGPLLDLDGRVIGICVPLGTSEDQFAGVESYDSGIGFAIHVDHLRGRLPRMMKGEDLKRGLLGLSLDGRDPIVGLPDPATTPPEPKVEPGDGALPIPKRPESRPATASGPAYQPGDARGLRIIEDPRGPALEAGLKKGDEILRVDGITTPRLLDFRRAVARKAAGDTVEIVYRRDGTEHTTNAKLFSADELRSQSQPATRPATQDG